ncbi:hypothetical protein C1I94_01800 [Akkermansia muciniphila]|nr:hypothetical protein C1I94_01800 [Akkermansia muciniphila]
MIRIYTFTYAGDAQEAVACVRCARTALPEAVVTVVDDSAAPVPPEARRALVAYGARYRRSSFPRCGNLRGPECVRGIIATLAKGAADGDTVVKIDSDTALLSGGWVREMKHNGLALHAAGYRVPRNPSERSAYGNCYALSGRAARMAAEALECAAIPRSPRKTSPSAGPSWTSADGSVSGLTSRGRPGTGPGGGPGGTGTAGRRIRRTMPAAMTW